MIFESDQEVVCINSNQDGLVGIRVNNTYHENVVFQIKYNRNLNEIFIAFGKHSFIESPQIMFTFKNGRLISIDDVYLYFSLEEASVYKERAIRNGKIHGIVSEFDTEKNYMNGKIHGTTKYFYKNGELKYEMNFFNGILYGKYRVFDEEGNLVYENDITNENKKVKWYVRDKLVEADDYRKVRWLSDHEKNIY